MICIWLLHYGTPLLDIWEKLNEVEFRVLRSFLRIPNRWKQNKCHFLTCHTLSPKHFTPFTFKLILIEIQFTWFWFIYIYFIKLFCKKHLMSYKFFSFFKNRTCSFNGNKHVLPKTSWAIYNSNNKSSWEFEYKITLGSMPK